MAGARIGALGGPPALLRACLQVKIAAVRLNTNRLAQVGAAAALQDEEWLRRGEEVIRRNLAAVREVASLVVEPSYGFSCVVDCAEIGASAQELTVALCKRKVAVYPGDGLGEVGATTTIRLNVSDPDPRAVARFAGALPDAIAEARTRVYREGVREFFHSAGTERGRRLAALLG
jgi:histidinol-phosphate aminotransferase